MACPNTVTLRMTAETGSSAPRMAVGVEPINWMALVVHARDSTVGMMAKAVRFIHPLPVAGSVSSCLMGIIAR